MSTHDSLPNLRKHAAGANALWRKIAASRADREVRLSHGRVVKSGTTTKRVPPAGKAFRDGDRDFKRIIAGILNTYPQQVTAPVATASTWSEAARLAKESSDACTARWLTKAGFPV